MSNRWPSVSETTIAKDLSGFAETMPVRGFCRMPSRRTARRKPPPISHQKEKRIALIGRHHRHAIDRRRMLRVSLETQRLHEERLSRIKAEIKLREQMGRTPHPLRPDTRHTQTVDEKRGRSGEAGVSAPSTRVFVQGPPRQPMRG